MRLKKTWLVEGLDLHKVTPILLGSLLLFAVIFLPGLSYNKLAYAQAASDVGKSNPVSALTNNPISGLASPSAAFISSDVNTCALDDPSTFLHIECASSLPILFPSISQISTTNKSVSVPNNDTLLASADNFTQDSQNFDSNFVNSNESSLDNSTFPSFDYRSGSSSDSFDISDGGSSFKGFNFDSSSDSNSSDTNNNNISKAKSQSTICIR